MTKINSHEAAKYIIFLSGAYQALLVGLAVPDGLSLTKVLITILLLLSGLLLVTFFIKTKHRLRTECSVYVRAVYSMLLAWSLFVIFRSFSLNSQDLLTLLGNNQVAWVWLAPLAIVFGLKDDILVILVRFLVALCAASIPIFVVSYLLLPDIVTVSLREIFATSIFLLLVIKYLSGFQKLIVTASISCLLIISYMLSIRINLALVIAACGCLALMYLFRRSSNYINNIVKKVLILIGLSLFLLGIATLSSTLASNETMTQDTRTFLFIELFADMSGREQIVGRGALGRYYSPFFENWNEMGFEGGDSENRLTVEVGYLKMILKGGFILVLLYLTLLIPACWQGIFWSNNFLVRACGFYVFMHLIFWIISMTPGYLPSFLILWVAAGACFSKSLRGLSDSDVRSLFADVRANSKRILRLKRKRESGVVSIGMAG